MKTIMKMIMTFRASQSVIIFFIVYHNDYDKNYEANYEMNYEIDSLEVTSLQD